MYVHIYIYIYHIAVLPELIGDERARRLVVLPQRRQDHLIITIIIIMIIMFIIIIITIIICIHTLLLLLPLPLLPLPLPLLLLLLLPIMIKINNNNNNDNLPVSLETKRGVLQVHAALLDGLQHDLARDDLLYKQTIIYIYYHYQY